MTHREIITLGSFTLAAALLMSGMAASESAQQEAEATAASVQDAQRTARLQARIDRQCGTHPDPLQCALRVVQQQEPGRWTPATKARSASAALVAGGQP